MNEKQWLFHPKEKKFAKKIKKGISQPSSGRILDAKFKMRENLLHSQAMYTNVSNKGCKSRNVKMKQNDFYGYYFLRLRVVIDP